MKTLNAPIQPRIRVAIHQPNLLPRLKVLQKIANADIWCVLDSTQYCVREWQNRARIVSMHGNNQTFWLSVPVHRPRGRNTLISEVTFVDPLSTGRLLKQNLLHAFRGAPYWDAISGLLLNLESLFSAETLVPFSVGITSLLLQIAGRQPTVLFTSSLPIMGKSSTLMAAICNHLNATAYLSDSGSRGYLQPDFFSGIDVLWQNWHEPPEVWQGISSWRDVSSINYLARVGPERFAQHIIGGEFMPDSNFDAHASKL